MSNDVPTPPADDFPAGQTGDMRDVLLSPPTGGKPATPSGPWKPPTAEELQTLLPQYEITALLGRGGMGAVYKGTQIALDRPVAIKILSNQLEDADASFAERFKNEARAMAKLSHPGIVGVYDFGERAGGLLYIVMEFIEGTDVAKMLAQQRRLHTEHAMAITAHVCDALAYAHERGIIHRDIKPANIMVGYDGVVKVADFGLAKMNSTSAQSGLTQSGMAMGTLHYMAPEALMLGSAVDHRADVYAVGVMLYQMLTGKIPQGLFELPSLQVPGLDPRYDGIIGKALREDRSLRYPSVLNMRHDLDAILTRPVVKVEAAAAKAPAALETQARPQRPAGQPYRPPQPAVIVRTEKKSSPVLWTVVVALAALAAWLLLNRPANEIEQRQTAEVQAAVEPVAGLAASTSDLARATKEMPFVNSLGMKFVPVPGTKVLMCVHETRKGDYAMFAAQNAGLDSKWSTMKDDDRYPVVFVNWHEAQAFCAWLTQKDGIKHRLPTDHEWSFAVGIGDLEGENEPPEARGRKNKDSYPWGGSWPPPNDVGNYSDDRINKLFVARRINQTYNDGHPDRAPVMQFKPNLLGIHDLGGNAWEWCEDWYNASQTQRVMRGSSWWGADESALQSVNRHYPSPEDRSKFSDYGFRCVVELPVAPASAIPPAASATSTTASATKDTPFVNSLGMKFVPVPRTKVLFCIHETRKKDYDAYASANIEVNADWIKGGSAEDFPVVFLSWNDAQSFCDWLSQKEGIRYRLPSDRDWSIAIGLGRLEDAGASPESLGKLNTEIYPWGTSWPPPNDAGNFWDDAINNQLKSAGLPQSYKDSHGVLAPVMSFPANSLGLHDLAGNACEYCDDWYNSTQKERVWRGSSGWTGRGKTEFRSSVRGHNPPDFRSRLGDLGFRCVIELTQT